jgi:hypothetical protein
MYDPSSTFGADKGGHTTKIHQDPHAPDLAILPPLKPQKSPYQPSEKHHCKLPRAMHTYQLMYVPPISKYVGGVYRKPASYQ